MVNPARRRPGHRRINRLVALALYGVWAGIDDRRVVVSYGSRVIAPLDGTLCPGATLEYPVHVQVTADELPTQNVIVEGWYSEAHGVVLRSTATTEIVPLVRPVDVQTIALRIVPDVAPGCTGWIT